MITMKIKDMFFDRAAVIDRVGVARVKVLSKIGAFVRRRARSSMRRRKKASAPGKPPSVHAGQLKDMLYFGYDPGTESVVVGPVRFAKGEAPALNEYGGQAQRRRFGVVRTVTYPARPFMGPALKAEEPRLASMWQDSIRGGA